MMSTNSDLSFDYDESEAAWLATDEAADQIEAAWAKVTSPQGSVELLRFVPKPGTKYRLAVLEELVKTDLEQRWRRGQQIRVEYYLMRLPELGHNGRRLVRLLTEEYRVRHDYGDRPNVQEFCQRFPSLAATLKPVLLSLGITQISTGNEPPSDTLPAADPTE